jgi:hypothetical protein
MITIEQMNELTEATLDGGGVFDVLMRANKAHLEAEYVKQRIKGPEYATVYLGSLESVLRISLEFILQREKNALELQLMEQQVILAEAQVRKTEAEILIAEKQVEIAQAELEIAQQNALKIPAEIDHINAQTSLVEQNTVNAVTQNDTMIREQCKLAAEYDLLLSENLKAVAETSLLNQKNMTEKAQTIGSNVDADSVVGRQKLLYQAQTDGFKRDSEQEAAKILVNSWVTRRSTDEGTTANDINKLEDATVGIAVSKLLQGIGINA